MIKNAYPKGRKVFDCKAEWELKIQFEKDF